MRDEVREEKLGKLEALLFVHGEPLSFKKIEEVLGLSALEVETLVPELARELESKERGLSLLRQGERVQLATKLDFSSVLDAFVKSELREDLTPASLETLAIVAYFGPLSRSKIEYYRGVNSAFTLRNLLIRGLVERSADPAHPRGSLYAPSFELMKHLGVAKRDDLPEYEKFQSLLVQFEAQIPQGESGSLKESQTPPQPEGKSDFPNARANE